MHAGAPATGVSPTANAPFQAGGAQPGASMQSLQQLLAPRRPSSLDTSGQFVPTQGSREASIGSGSTNASSIWGDSTQTLPTGYGHPNTINMAPAALPSAPSHGFTPQIYPQETTHRADSFSGAPHPPPHPQLQSQQQQQGQLMANPRHQSFSDQQSLPNNFPGQPMAYAGQSAAFNPNAQEYGQPRGYMKQGEPYQ